MKNRLYLLAILALVLTPSLPVQADIPPPPEKRKEIAQTPRITPPGKVTQLSERAFARTGTSGNAKIVIPRAVFEELAAAVAKKSGGAAPGAARGSGGIPPTALLVAGIALSGACLYLIVRAPRYRAAGGVALVALAAFPLLWTPRAEATEGPVVLKSGQVTIESPAEGTEVVIYIPETSKASTSPPSASK